MIAGENQLRLLWHVCDMPRGSKHLCLWAWASGRGAASQPPYRFKLTSSRSNKKGRRNRRPFVLFEWRRLLRGLLARRIERAGIVDFGDLVIAEAEHLAQDLVGVLAEQRRTGHLAR